MSFLPAFLAYLYLAFAAPQWRIVEASGEIQARRGDLALTEAERQRVTSAWAWSEWSAPQSVAPALLGRARLEEPSPRLVVRVVRQAQGRPPADLRLVAGPREMWSALPEAFLPSWPVPRDGVLSIPVDAGKVWRLRVAGQGEGSWWTEIPAGSKTATVTATKATGIDLAVQDPQGAPVHTVLGFLQEANARHGFIEFLGYLRDAGKLEVPGLPDDREVALLVRDPNASPLVLRGRPSALPHRVRLMAGAELLGRVTDSQGKPLPGVPIEVESFAARDLPQIQVNKGATEAQGKWRVRGLPVGKVALSVRAPGFVPRSEILDLAAGGRDLGTWVLEPGVGLAVQVVDETGEPVPEARVTAHGGRIAAKTDRRGLANLDGLPTAPLDLDGAADRHLAGTLRLGPPFPQPARLVLPRALTVLGRLVTASGAPVEQGAVRVDAGSCQREAFLDTAGRFELSVPPETPGELLLRSPRTAELRVRLRSGSAGEVRDLGDLAAPAGLSVVGQVVRAADGAPLPGASVWVPRQGPDGPAVAWATRDLLQALSGDNGCFELSGLLPATPAVLRVEAPGFARGQIPVPPGTGAESPLDLGTIVLSDGATLRVEVDDSRAAATEDEGQAVARVDLGNRWLEPDLLSAAVRDGVAVLPHVPQGVVTVSVLAGRRLLCDQQVTVPESGELTVDCRRPRLLVSGRVLVGGVPAPGGTLMWNSPNLDVPSRIDTLTSPLGLRQQQVAGEGRPQVNVTVDDDGRFATEDLAAGPWQVLWSGEPGTLTGSLSVEIPPGSAFETTLPFAGQAVTGTVTDAEGKPVEGSRVRELGGGALAFTDADGRFSLLGLKPGKALLQAQKLEETSSILEVKLESDRPPPPIRLRLGERKSPTVMVVVTTPDRIPISGAFVFLDEEGKGQRLITAAADGKATATLEAPLPARVRAAAFVAGRWGFSAWTSRAEAIQEGLPVMVAGGGSLIVESGKKKGSPRIVSDGGWDVTWLLRLLGSSISVSPEEPLQLAGLPAGRYTVTLDGSSLTVAVRADEGTEARLE